MVITLIPKITKLVSAAQFRPISCCNVLYKYLSKMVCRRLKKVLPSIISNSQSAFVKGISLIHTILICQDLMRHYRRKTPPRCLMKIDLRKAYDMVRLKFIIEMIHRYKFPPNFIQMVMECVTMTKFSVKVNGDKHGYFKGRIEQRHGDPMSPFLFFMVMEYLSRVLNKMTLLPNFRFYPMCKETTMDTSNLSR